MMIVAHHAPSLMQWGWLPHMPASMVHGVSFFFVLSGFILTHVYSSKPMPSYGLFIRARFARLWPVHAFSLILLVLLVRHDSITFDGPGMFDKWVVLGFNLTLLHSIFPFLAYTFSWNAVSWSISTEMFFYFAFPLLVLNIGRSWHWKMFGMAVLVIVVISLQAAAGWPTTSDNYEVATGSFGTYPNPLVRGLEFCAGMATWVLWNRHLRHLKLSLWAWSALEFAAVALCVGWIGFAFFWAFPLLSPRALLWYGPCGSFWVFAILIAVFASGRGVFSRALSVRPLLFLGDVSFSIYMLHQLLMKAFVTSFNWPDVPAAIYFGVLLALASASYVLVEKPGQRLLLGRAPTKIKPAMA